MFARLLEASDKRLEDKDKMLEDKDKMLAEMYSWYLSEKGKLDLRGVLEHVEKIFKSRRPLLSKAERRLVWRELIRDGRFAACLSRNSDPDYWASIAVSVYRHESEVIHNSVNLTLLCHINSKGLSEDQLFFAKTVCEAVPVSYDVLPSSSSSSSPSASSSSSLSFSSGIKKKNKVRSSKALTPPAPF